MSNEMSDVDETQPAHIHAPETRADRQTVSVVHLVMGLVFLGVAGVWALHAADVIESVEVEWVMPLILVVAGAAGLVASVARGTARRAP